MAAAVSRAGAEAPAVVAVDSRLPGVHRTNDLDLIALRGTQTAALRLENVDLPTANVIHPDARAFLPSVRPAFLALQCGMSIGLARAALHAADKAGAEHHGLGNDVRELSSNLEQTISALYQGVRNGSFKTHAAPLFRLRIALADLAQKAVQLELMSSGGKAYLTAHGQAFARRWREVAFVPIVTPSLSQLKAELARHDLIQGKAA